MARTLRQYFILFALLIFSNIIFAQQSDTLPVKNDSVNKAILLEYNRKLAISEKQRVADSLKKADLEKQLKMLKTTDNLQKEDLIKQLKTIESNESRRLANKKSQIESLRNTLHGYPVTGIMHDTLFFVYSKIGASTAADRAANITRKIKKLYDNDFLKIDSIKVIQSENTYDIDYSDMIIMSVSENDALWYDKTMPELATHFKNLIHDSIETARKENSWLKISLRIGLVLLVLIFGWFVIKLIGKGYNRLLALVRVKKDKWLRDLSYRDYTFITADQELQVIFFAMKIFRWIIFGILLYISLPILFSIFPFSRDWANALFNLIWSPFKHVLVSVWNYLPKLFSILVIIFVMRYVIRFIKYIFREIESEKLKIPRFHADWAMPTFSIVKVLLYAFTLIIIFPYLPGSDSETFKGVTVFIGVLVSFGSSSIITNMIAGIVITYMRPFKIGDRIKVGEMSGDVVEKTILVTRLKTIKNEIVTIPNSSILTGSTTNFSSIAKDKGLIVHTSVTIGYDVPWKDMHEALIEAALRTEMIMKVPKPYVLQTALEDFYVSYQINAYTKNASKQALIYSHLHQNIQDVCNERGIEIMSPHYRANRDGNKAAIPDEYIPENYKSPGFNVNIDKDKK